MPERNKKKRYKETPAIPFLRPWSVASLWGWEFPGEHLTLCEIRTGCHRCSAPHGPCAPSSVQPLHSLFKFQLQKEPTAHHSVPTVKWLQHTSVNSVTEKLTEHTHIMCYWFTHRANQVRCHALLVYPQSSSSDTSYITGLPTELTKWYTMHH